MPTWTWEALIFGAGGHDFYRANDILLDYEDSQIHGCRIDADADADPNHIGIRIVGDADHTSAKLSPRNRLNVGDLIERIAVGLPKLRNIVYPRLRRLLPDHRARDRVEHIANETIRETVLGQSGCRANANQAQNVPSFAGTENDEEVFVTVIAAELTITP